MDDSIHIEKIGSEAMNPALDLLEQFFNEEGFDTPVAQIRASLAARLANQFSAVFLARQDSEALGVATVTTSHGLEYSLSAEIEDLYVLPQERGRGIASALIEAACNWCRRQGCNVVLVTVTPQGDAAHRLMDFYQQRGFVNTRRVLLQRSLTTHEE